MGHSRPVPDSGLLREPDAGELWRLRWHFGSAYRISLGTSWWAVRRDANPQDIAGGKGVLEAATAAELRLKMRDDYARQPVPRAETR
jgi:hypothetical protein